MTLKDTLKRICDFEKAVRESELKISKANKKLAEVKEKVRKKLEEKEDAIALKEDEIKKLKGDIDFDERYRMPGVDSKIFWTFGVVIIVTILLGFLVKALVTKVFGATTPGDATGVMFGIYSTLYVICLLIARLMDLLGWGCVSIGGAVVLLITWLTNLYFRLFKSWNLSIGESIIWFAIIAALIEAIIGVIICYKERKNQLFEYAKHRRWAREKKAALASKEKELEELRKDLVAYKASSKRSLALMQQDIDSLVNECSANKGKLKNLYDTGPLHPKYSNWVAAATIYEYLDTGRCTELTGYHGAYNLYEREIIANRVLDSLSSIQYNTGRISNTQQLIRSQLAECNRNVEALSIRTYGL